MWESFDSRVEQVIAAAGGRVVRVRLYAHTAAVGG
ncbi:hypothetical protein ABH920_005161 [Catenulispora sp. EB89]